MDRVYVRGFIKFWDFVIRVVVVLWLSFIIDVGVFKESDFVFWGIYIMKIKKCIKK